MDHRPLRLLRDPTPAPCVTGRGFRDFQCSVYEHCVTVAGRRKWPGMTCALCSMATALTDVSGDDRLLPPAGDCPRCKTPVGGDGLCACHVQPITEPDEDPKVSTARERDARELLRGFGIPVFGAPGEFSCSNDGCFRVATKGGLCGRCYRARRADAASDCIVEGCGKPAFSKGLCSAHYSRRQRAAKASR